MRTYQVTYYNKNRDGIKTCFFNAVNDTAAHKLAFSVIPRGTEYVGLALITKDSFLFPASHKKVPTLISEQRMREKKMSELAQDMACRMKTYDTEEQVAMLETLCCLLAEESEFVCAAEIADLVMRSLMAKEEDADDWL